MFCTHYSWCKMFICSVMAVPATVLYFTCYDQLRAVLSVKMGDCAHMAPLFAGALARGKFIAVKFFKRIQNCTRWPNDFFSIMQVAFIHDYLFILFLPCGSVYLKCHPAWVFFCQFWDIKHHKLYSEPFFFSSHFIAQWVQRRWSVLWNWSVRSCRLRSSRTGSWPAAFALRCSRRAGCLCGGAWVRRSYGMCPSRPCTGTTTRFARDGCVSATTAGNLHLPSPLLLELCLVLWVFPS